MPRKLTPEDQRLWDANTQNIKRLHKVLPAVPPPSKPAVQDLRTPKPSIPIHSAALPLPKVDRGVLRAARLESRLDLHGYTLDAGYQALESFLKTAQARGIKVVLVITGKGRVGSDQTFRKQVPRWLEETALRALVSGLQSAKLKDGGDGAFYVRVRGV